MAKPGMAAELTATMAECFAPGHLSEIRCENRVVHERRTREMREEARQRGEDPGQVAPVLKRCGTLLMKANISQGTSFEVECHHCKNMLRVIGM